MINFKKAIRRGIPSELPDQKERNPNISHAPNRKDILNKKQNCNQILDRIPTKIQDKCCRG